MEVLIPFQFSVLQSIYQFSTLTPLNARSHLYFFIVIFVSRAAHKNSNKRHKIFWQQLRRDTENGEMQRKKKITGRKREQMEAAQRSRNWSKVLLCCCSCCCCWTCNGTANGAATPDAVGLHWQQQFQFQLLLIEIKVYVRRDPPPPPPLCSPSLDKYQMSFAGLCESLA